MRAYREQAGKRKRGRDFSWSVIASLINQTLGLDFDVGGRAGDRLAKFVDGEPKETGSEERRSIIPESRRLQAIRDYLMHPDIQYLAAYEMVDDPDVPVAARAFAEFLADDGRTGGPVSGAVSSEEVTSEQIKGDYEYARGENDHIIDHRLSLNPLVDGLFEAEEITEYFDTRQALSDFSEWREPERYRRRRSRIRSTGWAAKNKHDCLFLFLKDQGDCSFTSYIAAGIDRHADNQTAVEWLYLQKYGPLSYFYWASIPKDHMSTFLAEELKKGSLFFFERIGNVSKVSEKDKKSDAKSADGS